MRLIDWLQPRDPRAAARKAAIMTAVAGAILSVETLIRLSQGMTDILSSVAAAVVLFGISTAFVWVHRHPSHAGQRAMWAAVPLVGVVIITVLDLATRDAGFTGLFSFVFPALYAASQLRGPGVVLVSLLVQTASAVVAFSVLDPWTAAVTMVYMAGIGLTATFLLFQSVERTARLVDRLERLAAVDPLTGLVTRRVLDEATRTALTRSPDVGTGLILLDVDHFKEINDKHGHPAGDKVLVQLAAALRAQCRSTDVVSRLGGDEIAVLLPGITAADLPVRADALVDAARRLSVVLSTGVVLRLSISGGAAHAPSHAIDHRSLYTAADIALYEAKRAGRDRVVLSEVVTPDQAEHPAGPQTPDTEPSTTGGRRAADPAVVASLD